jgi:CBS domain-containing protein
MNVGEIMTKDPACCTPDTGLQEVAQMMVDCDCGCIPVVDSEGSKMPVGMITDRDITCRVVAKGQNPSGSDSGGTP